MFDNFKELLSFSIQWGTYYWTPCSYMLYTLTICNVLLNTV